MEKNSKRFHSVAIVLVLCLITTWFLLFLPFPPFNYYAVLPFLAISFILSIICLVKDDILAGIIGLFAIFIISPIIFLFSIGMFFMILANILDTGKFPSFSKEQLLNPQTITVPIPQTEPDKQEPENPDAPPSKYKYLITLNNDRVIMADNLIIENDMVIYETGTLQVSINKTDIRSYQKIVINRQTAE